MTNSVQPISENDASGDSVLDPIALVDDLFARQDHVLQELDLLATRVEKYIEQVISARKSVDVETASAAPLPEAA